MRYVLIPIEIGAPGEHGYARIHDATASSATDYRLSAPRPSMPELMLLYGEHRGTEKLRQRIEPEAKELTTIGDWRRRWAPTSSVALRVRCSRRR